MTDHSPQLEMLGKKGAKLSVDVEEELARGCRDRHHALVKCYEVSNLAPKQVYVPLKIEQATFSKIISGTAFLDPRKKLQWMELCGNIIPIRYDAIQVDHELKPIQTELEARVAQLEDDLAFERQLNRRLMERR